MMPTPTFNLRDAAANLQLPPITASEFAQLSRFLRDKFGIDLKEGKENLVSARLGKKIRAGQFRSFRAYFEHVWSNPNGGELIEMVDALTTNHTSFFREAAHFELLKEVAATSFRNERPLRIWSAACSTGEEPYTIVLSLLGAASPPAPHAVEVVASDISTRVLERAKAATYPVSSLSAVPVEIARTCFQRVGKPGESAVRIRPDLAAKVRFARVNLVEPLPAWPPFHIVFCRNVMIYFDTATQRQVVASLAAKIVPGGYLLVGHSESLAGVEHGLEYVKPAVYRKPAGSGRR